MTDSPRDSTEMSSPVSLDLEGIKERVDQATPAPWHRAPDPSEPREHVVMADVYVVAEMVRWPSMWATERTHVDNAEFIAHARSDVPALVGEVERLRDQVMMLAVGLTAEGAPSARRAAMALANHIVLGKASSAPTGELK